VNHRRGEEVARRFGVPRVYEDVMAMLEGDGK